MSIPFLEVEFGVTCIPYVPHESVSKRWLSQGLLLTGLAGTMPPRLHVTVCLVSASLCGGTTSVQGPALDPCTS